jgi:hypothetical protein
MNSILKRLAKAAPVIIANAPAIIAAAKEVKKALKKPASKA